MADERDVEVRTNLPTTLARLKQIDVKRARETRRALRGVGLAIIEHQQRIVTQEPVGGVVTKTRYTAARPSSRGGYRRGPRARELGGARIVSVESRRSDRGQSTELRQRVAQNLVTRVSTPQKGASVRVTTRRPFWGSKALNARKWRHPVFGSDAWVEQAGNQYFARGAELGVDKAREELFRVVDEANALVSGKPPLS